MHPILAKFGSRVRELRRNAGVSQEELAARCQLHRTYIGGIERGERNVGLINVHAIAQALELPLWALFQDSDDTASDDPTRVSPKRPAPKP